MTLFEKILAARGLTTRAAREEFLHPNYASAKHDPFLLPDMRKAVDRLKKAHAKGEKIVIYGDYDIDGLSATRFCWMRLASLALRKLMHLFRIGLLRVME